MAINAPVDPHIYTDNRGLTSLKAAARSGENSEETLRKVAGQFESIMINQVMKTMRQATLGDDGLMSSEQTKFYQSMFDQQMAQEITRGRGLGLAELLVRQLSQQTGTQLDEPTPAKPGATAMPLAGHDQLPYSVQRPTQTPVTTAAPTATTPLTEAMPQDWQPESPAEFVRDLWPHAEKAAAALGTEPEVLLAQAALESGWGKHQMRQADGRSAHNLFGIKADMRWDGERVSQQTLEFREGLMQQERAAFRAYASPAESFEDYVAFIKGNPRYQPALDAARNGGDYIREIHRAGYATDPDYHSKINGILNSPHFESALSQFKTAAHRPLGTVSDSAARDSLAHNRAGASARGGEV